MEKLKMHTPDLTRDHIDRIRELFPNCVTEAKDAQGAIKLAVDFDLLRQELSGQIVEGPQERYHLNWPGKREALLIANAPIAKTLRPARDESINFDTTKNLFIEGDNLDALKLLQETYLGKIKMIYIDPPYNTGNDFIYEDDFAEDVEEFKLRTNQKDAQGNRLVANTESNGRFHSDWLSMLYSRLKLARNLMRDDGVIFISIGVEEISNLKKLMDEIFGESNFIEIFSWVKTSTPPALSTKSRKTNEYILCYEKSRTGIKYNGEALDGGDQPLLNTGNSVGRLTFPKDKVLFSFIDKGTIKAGKRDRVALLQDIEINGGFSTKDFTIEGEFKWTEAFLNNEISKGTTFIIKSEKLSIRFIRQGEGFKRPTNFIKEKYTSPVLDKKGSGVGTNENASSEVAELMGKEVFSYPKPISLIEHIINFTLDEKDIVMDFFAGSGTTADAVMQWSSRNQKPAQYILVQLPEDLNESFRNATDPNVRKIIKNGIDLLSGLKKPCVLSELTKERIKRASAKLSSSSWEELDVGFRVLRIDTSNMADIYYVPDAVKQSDLLKSVDNIKPDRNNAEDLLFQVLLDWGVDLTLPIAREKLAGKQVYFVDGNALAACFDTGISEDFVKELAARKPLRVVFRDNGFASDSVKINAEQIFRQISPTTDMKTL